MMNKWHISDKRVVETIRANGFICEKPKSKGPMPSAISFQTQSLEEERAAEEACKWHETDCPIQWDKSYVLPDGTVIKSSGTRVMLASESVDL